MRRPILFLLVVSGFCLQAQRPRDVRQEITSLHQILSAHHVAPRPVDDEFSATFLDELLTDLDPDKLIFLREDTDALGDFRDRLDDELKGEDTGFLTLLEKRYDRGMRRSVRLADSLLTRPLDWSIAEAFDPEAPRAADMDDLFVRHRRNFKFHVLERLADLFDRDSLAADDFFAVHVAEAAAHVNSTTMRPLRRLLRKDNGVENHVRDQFLKTAARLFDPHTTFMSRPEYDEFASQLSAERYRFGFMLGQGEGGQVIISALAPGGPAWKSGVLRVSDALISVRWDDEPVVHVEGMHIDDVNELVGDPDGEVLEMAVRGTEGRERTVQLRREKLEGDDNVIQSFVLQGDVKAGYIYLPDFYTHWDDEQEGARCANDVAREVMRLKLGGIDGLILDLRFNGGGSLYEAQAMAGIFVDEGPLALISARHDDKPTVMKDLNRGTLYDGPLLVLVNGASASASEILAAALQDYERAIIVGGRTYGKSTAQILLPLEVAVNPNFQNPDQARGFVKLTTERVYRVTGASTQARGVVPDVPLPDIFSVLEVAEAYAPFSLPADSLSGVPFRPAGSLPREALRERSRARVATHPELRELTALIGALPALLRDEEKRVTLAWPSFRDRHLAKTEHMASIDSVRGKGDHPYEVHASSTSAIRLMLDAYARTMQECWTKTLSGDPWLHESFRILRDHIQIHQSR